MLLKASRAGLALLLLFALGACTTLAPGAHAVRITENPADVAGCRAVGPVSSSPPYVVPGDDLKQLRNDAVALRANTVLRTGPRILITRGIAYRCGS